MLVHLRRSMRKPLVKARTIFNFGDYARNLQEEVGHLPKADEHLRLAHQHLKAAGIKSKFMTRQDGEAVERFNISDDAATLIDAAAGAKPGEEHSHIDGTHISHYGPEGVHSLTHDKSRATSQVTRTIVWRQTSDGCAVAQAAF
jgi:hypothetical protein